MNHAGGADEYDPLQAAAYAIIEQAIPFFDFSDDEASDCSTYTALTPKQQHREHRERQLSPIQHSQVPFTLVDILSASAEDATLCVPRPATSQLATLQDFTEEFSSPPTNSRDLQSRHRDRGSTSAPHADAVDDMFSRISTANGQRSQVKKGRRRQLPLTLPSLQSNPQVKYLASPAKKTLSQASRR